MTHLESPESSSPVITRAVAAGLAGVRIRNYQLPGWQTALLLGLGSMPQGFARFAVSRFQRFSGQKPALLEGFSIDALIAERLADYQDLPGRHPVITIGAGLGGPTTYLSLAMRAPFLPQAFVTTIQGGAPDGNVRTYLQRSAERSLEIAAADPRLMTIQHYDPVHDGWLTRWVNHLRFKLLSLPEAYAQFIRSRLEPGGTLVFLEGGASWLRYRIGPRSIFQVGGWGGIPAEEYLNGSDRLSRYARQAGLRSADWSLSEYPLERGPESEWGSETELAASAQAFCEQEGYRFLRVHLPHPHDFSRLAFLSAVFLLEQEHRQPAGTLVEMFTQFDALTALQTGLLPVWLVFNTQDSLDFLRAMSALFPPQKPVFFSPLATFSVTPDMVPWSGWEQALQEFAWTNIGARESHYPADTRALVGWDAPLLRWAESHQNPVQSRLSANDLVRLVDTLFNTRGGKA